MTTISKSFRQLALAALAAPLVALAAPDDDPGLPPYPVLRHSESDLSRGIDAAVALDGGSVLLAGRIFDASGPASWGWALEADGSGRRIWEKELGKKAQNASFAAASAAGAGAMLVGTVNEEVGALGHASAWIVSMAADGRVQWDRSLTFGQLTRAHAIVPTLNGAFLVAGTVRRPARDDQAWIVRVDGAGQVALQKTLDTPKDFVFGALAALDDGSFLVAGHLFAGPGAEMHGWIARFGADAKPQWSHTLAARESSVAALGVAADGSIALALTLGGRREQPIQLMRLSAAGETLQAPVKTGLCKVPALWRHRSGQLRLAGVACASGKGQAPLGLIADLAHPERLQAIEAIVGGDVTQLVPLPGSDAIGVLGMRQGGDKTSSVFVTRPLP